jgi:hypothetical protein
MKKVLIGCVVLGLLALMASAALAVTTPAKPAATTAVAQPKAHVVMHAKPVAPAAKVVAPAPKAAKVAVKKHGTKCTNKCATKTATAKRHRVKCAATCVKKTAALHKKLKTKVAPKPAKK